MKVFNYLIKILLSFILTSFLINCKVSDKNSNSVYQPKKNDTIEPTKDKISLLFIGDVMEHMLQVESAYVPKTGKYDFSSQFEFLKPLFLKKDAVIANFEVTLNGKPYSGYPKFSTPDELTFDLKQAGIDYLVMANNHINDFSKTGLEKTMKIIDSVGFKRTGVFYDEKDKLKNNPMIIDKNGFKIAVFNYTYGLNNDTIAEPNLINLIDKDSIKKDLQSAKKQNFDAIIVFFHWGIQYERVQNEKQEEIADLCFDNGADIIIGSHPHVIQPMQFFDYQMPDGSKKKVFVAYSLGNFVSNYGTWRYCDGGAIIELNLVKQNGKIEIIQPKYDLIWVYQPFKDARLKTFYVVPVTQFENKTDIGADFYKQLHLFINDSRGLLDSNNVNVPENK